MFPSRLPFRRLVVLVVVGLPLGNSLSAATPTNTKPTSDPASVGHVLLGEMNCVACHAASAAQSAWITPKSAPRLEHLGDRVSPQWIASYLAAPHEVSPGVTMPDVLGGLAVADRERAVEALTHFLLSRSPAKAKAQLPDRAAVRRGEVLYHTIGCVACHGPQDGKPAPADSVSLTNLESKWRFDGLRRFLRDPLSVRPSGRMPAMNLTDAEAGDLAQFLLRHTQVPAVLEEAQFRGPIHSFEELDSAEPMRTGPVLELSAAGAKLDRGAAAIRLTGWLLIDRPGDYTIFLDSVGACRLAVDDRWIIGQESWEPGKGSGRGQLRLEAGAHAIKVDLAQRGRTEPSMKVEWGGPGIEKQPIAATSLRSTRDPVPEPAGFVVEARKAAEGQALYAQFRCANCHESKPDTELAMPLASLDLTRGCLSEAPMGKSVNYHLDPVRRSALVEALSALKLPQLGAPSPQQQLHHALATFRCVACHSRNGMGGVSADRDAYFTSAGDDLGDEGRLPPRLDGVGDKLRVDAISDVLLKGAAVRPYLRTRMPQFGQANVAQLVELFAGLDRHRVDTKPSTDPPDVQKEVGRKLVGTDGLSCIACHRFNRQPAQAMQVVDLISVPDRLNEDWFRQFLIDPNRFHPGTRMPSFFPEGQSPLPALLGGDTARQQAAIWAYLSDRERARFPVGLGRQNVELVVGGEAVVYRGKLWEAGFRGIAVGYPGLLNIAFDAEECRLSLLWRGRFLNAGPHWTVQGMGQIRPLGTDVIVLPHGPSLATLADAGAPWPQGSARDLGLKFRGYQLDSQNQPTLLYSFKDRQIEDFVTPVEGRPSALRRTVTFVDALPERVFMRLGVGKISVVGAGREWRLNDALRIRVNGATVRGAGDKQELIVAVPVGEKNHRLEVEYEW